MFAHRFVGRRSDRRSFTTLRVVLSALVIGSSVTLAASAGAAPTDPAEPTAVASVEFVGAQWVPWFGSARGGAKKVIGSTDHSSLFHVSFLQLIDVDIASGAFTDAIGGSLDTNFEPGVTSPSIIDVAVREDGSTAYLLYTYEYSGSPYRLWVRPLDLTTGELGESSVIAEATIATSSGAITYAEATDTLYVYFQAYQPVATIMPTMFEVDPSDLSVTGTTDLTGAGITRFDGFSLDVSADGTELYAGNNNGIKVFDVTNFNVVDRTIAVPAYRFAVHDDTPSVTDRGSIYTTAFGSADLNVVDPDTSDTVTSTTTVDDPAGATINSITVDTDGTAILGLKGVAGIAVVEPGVGVLASAIRPAPPTATDPSGTEIWDVWIDKDPTHGTCYFATDGYFEDIAAYAVDGADCGGFVQRFDPIEGPLGIDGTLDVTYDADWTGGRAEPWAGIVVFVDCRPARVIRPPLSGVEEIRWRDLPPGTLMQIRSYTETQLDALGLTGLEEATCNYTDSENFGTISAGQLDVALDFLPLQVTVVVGAESASCAVVDGTARCWGDGSNGILGDGGTAVNQFDDWLDAYTPQPVALPGTVEATTPVTITPNEDDGVLSASDIDSINEHVCALSDSKIVCWGSNESGQFGVGFTGDLEEDSVDEKGVATRSVVLPNDSNRSNVPVAAVPSGDFTNTAVEAIGVGENHTCAVEEGVVYCWGTNVYGQLGDGGTTTSGTAVKVSTGGGFTNTAVTAVAAGFDHTCAVENGELYCWGRNRYGEVGDGTTNQTSVPVRVLDNDGFVNAGISDVVAADRATCAISAGSVYCWGSDRYGRLGNGPASSSDSSLPLKVIDDPAETFTNSSVTTLGRGTDHFCAVAGGTAFCWGLAEQNQLGRSIPEGSSTSPVRVDDVDDEVTGESVFTNAGVLSINGGTEHTCAATTTGAFCWGEPSDGRLGRGQVGGFPYLAGPVCCSALPQFTLDIDVEGDGRVTSDIGSIDCPGTCSADITVDELVTLTAVPATGSRFMGWGGACSGTAGCQITMSEARSVTATFASSSVDLTVVISGGGSVQVSGATCSSTCTVPVGADTQVTLTAVPQPGYVFLGWGGPCSGTGVCVVSLANAGQVTASFGPIPALPATGGTLRLAVVAAFLLGAGVLISGSLRRRRPV